MILVVDGNELFMRSLFAWRRRSLKSNKTPPFSYFFLLQLSSYVKMFNTSELSRIILATDVGESWRKKLFPSYKSQRKKERLKFRDIDWSDVYCIYNQLLSDLNTLSRVFVISLPLIEGDDIISCVCTFGDEQVVVVSQDTDFEQLTYFQNVRLFSTRTKNYKNVSNPLKKLRRKILKGDTSDNIPPAHTKKEMRRNYRLICLLHLPSYVTNRVYNYLRMLSTFYKQSNKKEFLNRWNYKFLKKLNNPLFI